MKATSELVIPDHLLDDSVDDSAPTPMLDIPVLLPDHKDERNLPTQIVLPKRRRSLPLWLISGLAFVVIAGGSAIAAYLTVSAKHHKTPMPAAAPAQFTAPTPVVTRIIEDPIPQAEEAIAIPPAPMAVIEAPPPAPPRAATRPQPAKPPVTEPTTKPLHKVVAAKPTPEPAVTQPAARPTPASPGVLMLGAKPPCMIHIDGKNTGMITPQRTIELSPGTHKVTLVNDNYSIEKSFDVTIRSGEKTKVIEDLSAAIQPAE